ncbi:MAG: hypothetical protein ACLFT4_03235 [Bacteroidales bacterium]
MRKVRGVKIVGFEKIERRLNRVIAELDKQSVGAFAEIARDVHRDADTIPPKIPRYTGDLKKSRFIVGSNGYEKRYGSNFVRAETARNHWEMVQLFKDRAVAKNKPTVYLGYTAPYAVYPHEFGHSVRPPSRTGVVKWTRPGSGAKYFQTALLRQKEKAKETIYKNMNLKSGGPIDKAVKTLKMKSKGIK